jgi:hypothetical protein
VGAARAEPALREAEEHAHVGGAGAQRVRRLAPVRLAPAWLDGREVIADVRYVVDDAELVLASDTAPPGEGTAHG